MAGQVHPIGVRPLMFKRSVNYVKIAVHKQPALDGNIYTVLFLGTGGFRLTDTSNSILTIIYPINRCCSRYQSLRSDSPWL